MVVSETRNGDESDYVSDTLGSTIGILNSTGTMTDRWEYWPYGEILSRAGTSATPLTFLGVIGYFQDVFSRLTYVRARHLRVDLARWLTVDPLWPTESRYLYAANNPGLRTDPLGLSPVLGGGGGGGNKECVKCSDLVTGSIGGAGPFLTCMSRNGWDVSALPGCLDTYGGDMSNSDWDNLYAYIACMLASQSVNPVVRGCDQCKSLGADPQFCCFQNNLNCLLKCAGKKGSGFYFCLDCCNTKFKKCLVIVT